MVAILYTIFQQFIRVLLNLTARSCAAQLFDRVPVNLEMNISAQNTTQSYLHILMHIAAVHLCVVFVQRQCSARIFA